MCLTGSYWLSQRRDILMKRRKQKKLIQINNNSNYCAAVLQGIAALFLSTKNNQKQNNFTFSTVLFTLKQTFSTFHSGRSPPFQADFKTKISLKGSQNMFFSKNLKNFLKKLADWVFSNGIVSERGKITALRKRKEVNSNGAIFFPKENR